MTVDLDSVKWWADLGHKFVTTFGVLGLGIWHWILWLKDKDEAVRWIEHHIERRKGEPTMNVLKELVTFIENLFQHHAPEIVQAAATAATQTAEQQAATDPKIQAGIVAFQAIQNLKVALEAPSVKPPVSSAPPAAS